MGDILTVLISIDDKAEISNKSTRKRDNNESAAARALLGYESSFSRILPKAVNPSSLLDIESGRANSGEGSVNRDETIELDIAAAITQSLPNGNLVVHGRQEVRVNFEVRERQIAGVIRPEDIAATNTISYEKIAEARISYGGRGQISDFQQPPYGYQPLDVSFPFRAAGDRRQGIRPPIAVAVCSLGRADAARRDRHRGLASSVVAIDLFQPLVPFLGLQAQRRDGPRL